ncbi:hypothetical protein B0H17DRAFT_1081446 [Mycena rosella]|uniref:Uncharacterized protein n=1 Tax=Mycena rosella TaxID=1033263 RepID=A0AAD7D213_MYCRO|nr:hypothetical protein B0H17DRAFT_1081446 [Mycena rosella]
MPAVTRLVLWPPALRRLGRALPRHRHRHYAVDEWLADPRNAVGMSVTHIGAADGGRPGNVNTLPGRLPCMVLKQHGMSVTHRGVHYD